MIIKEVLKRLDLSETEQRLFEKEKSNFYITNKLFYKDDILYSLKIIYKDCITYQIKANKKIILETKNKETAGNKLQRILAN
jgi:hypothetical protein